MVVLCKSKSCFTEVNIFSRWNSALRKRSSLGSESIFRFSLAGDTRKRVIYVEVTYISFLRTLPS